MHPWFPDDNLRQRGLNLLGASTLIHVIPCIWRLVHAVTLSSFGWALASYLILGLTWSLRARGVDRLGWAIANVIRASGYPDAAGAFRGGYTTARLSFVKMVPYWVGMASICALVVVLTWRSYLIIYASL